MLVLGHSVLGGGACSHDGLLLRRGRDGTISLPAREPRHRRPREPHAGRRGGTPPRPWRPAVTSPACFRVRRCCETRGCDIPVASTSAPTVRALCPISLTSQSLDSLPRTLNSSAASARPGSSRTVLPSQTYKEIAIYLLQRSRIMRPMYARAHAQHAECPSSNSPPAREAAREPPPLENLDQSIEALFDRPKSPTFVAAAESASASGRSTATTTSPLPAVVPRAESPRCPTRFPVRRPPQPARSVRDPVRCRRRPARRPPPPGHRTRPPPE